MRRPAWLRGVLFGLVVTAPAWAADGGVADDLDRNRRLLERWRADPEHYARLLRDLRDFHALPAGDQERLRTLDRGLHDTDPETGQRLWKVADRYATWVNGLGEADRGRLLGEANPDERLKIVRELRERQWQASLPKAVRKELADLPPDQLKIRLAGLRREEQAQRRQSRAAPRPRPVRLADFPPDVGRFVREQLAPHLRPEEKKSLDSADGNPTLLARTLVELSERHPAYPAPLPPHKPVKDFDDLPPAWKLLLNRVSAEKKRHVTDLNQYAGRWPDYALAVAGLVKTDRLARLPQLGPSRPAEFAPETADYVTHRLPAEVPPEEVKALAALAGHWPDYPRRLHELARGHHLAIPGLTLPGPREWWEGATAPPP